MYSTPHNSHITRPNGPQAPHFNLAPGEPCPELVSPPKVLRLLPLKVSLAVIRARASVLHLEAQLSSRTAFGLCCFCRNLPSPVGTAVITLPVAVLAVAPLPERTALVKDAALCMAENRLGGTR